ncbi:MAG: 16S rRNA (cytosine(967)-C(5))-methyltransferase RsmB [Candidatus Eremiobacteraeota bacterium]|nr:16S rRNA (cytosine(967)-C(5))-methyltransferase RsmB [Candidatus Eremiobacteraeota bacterium]
MNAREVALAVVRDVFPADSRRPRGAQESLDHHLRKTSLEQRDRAFATELAYGTIKMRRTIDWYLRPYGKERFADLPPVIREILRLGVHEILFMDSRAHATVFETVNLAKKYGHRGTAGLVNAVLRNILRDEPEPPQREAFEDEDDYLGTRFSFPTWMVGRWREMFDRGYLEEILPGMNLPARAAVRVNLLRSSVNEVREQLANDGVLARRSNFVPEVLVIDAGMVPQESEEAAQGRWCLQSEAAAMPVDVLNPQPGEAVLDLCSGRGNKAVQIASRLTDEGLLVCIERNSRKENLLRRRLQESGASCALTRVADARETAGAERFDRVLVDAPCSGLGILARHPEARWRKSPDDAARHAQLQLSMLSAAAQQLMPGGAIVYAVCSNDARETRDVVDDFLRRYDCYRGLIPARYETFQTEAGDVLVPPGKNGSDGFFIARIERTA